MEQRNKNSAKYMQNSFLKMYLKCIWKLRKSSVILFGPQDGNTSSVYGSQSYSLLLIHWARTMHICAGDITIIGSDNGLLPGRRQAIF